MLLILPANEWFRLYILVEVREGKMLQNQGESYPWSVAYRCTRPRTLILELQHSLMSLKPGTRQPIAFSASGK